MKRPEEDENTIIVERKQLMNSGGNPTSRIAHFLKPILNPKIQPLPKPPFHNSLSSTSKLKELEKGVYFKGRLKPQKSWKSWVNNLQKTHESIWKKVGIFDAIRGSNYKIKRDNELIMCLAEKWSPKTNTFVFSWGECSITLEDIMVLGGFPVMGNSIFDLCLKDNKFAKIKDYLIKGCSVIRRNCKNQVTHNGWMQYFMGKGGELEHVAFLVLWLSRYVLPTKSTIVFGSNNNVLSIAYSLAFGTKFALAPVVLASIYRDLTILKERIVVSNMEGNLVDRCDDLVVWAPFQFVQLWGWERFRRLSPIPASLVYGEPRVARWHDLRKIIIEDLRLEIECAGDSFVWRPYVVCLKNWDVPKFYCSDEGMWVVVDAEFDEELMSFVRCLRGCELVGMDCVMQYLPHRVGMQFGMDQNIPDFVPRLNDDYEVAWSNYVKPLEGVKVYLPPRLFVGDVTLQYSRWWRLMLGVDSGDGSKIDSLREASCIKGGISSSVQGMASQKLPIMMIDDDASNDSLIEQVDIVVEKDKGEIVDDVIERLEDVVAEKEEREMVADHTAFYTTFNKQEHFVAEKEHGIMVDDVASRTALYEYTAFVPEKETDNVVDELLRGKLDQDIGTSTKTCVEVVNANELGPETKKLCLMPVIEDVNQLGNDAIEGREVKHMYGSQVEVNKDTDFVKRFQHKSLVLEHRMSRLRRIVSMYKAVKLGSMVDGK